MGIKKVSGLCRVGRAIATTPSGIRTQRLSGEVAVQTKIPGESPVFVSFCLLFLSIDN